eukprot:6197303-Pleurochrysis_carterae.AAC.3
MAVLRHLCFLNCKRFHLENSLCFLTTLDDRFLGQALPNPHARAATVDARRARLRGGARLVTCELHRVQRGVAAPASRHAHAHGCTPRAFAPGREPGHLDSESMHEHLLLRPRTRAYAWRCTNIETLASVPALLKK